MVRTSSGKKRAGSACFAPRTVPCHLAELSETRPQNANPSEPIWQVPETKSELAIETLIREAGWPPSDDAGARTIEHPTAAPFCRRCRGHLRRCRGTAFVVQSPARKSAPVGAAAKADEPPVAHHRLHPVRTIPIIGRTIPIEAPAPQSASVTRQEQPPPKPDMAQQSRIERAEASDPVCGERGRRWFMPNQAALISLLRSCMRER